MATMNAAETVKLSPAKADAAERRDPTDKLLSILVLFHMVPCISGAIYDFVDAPEMPTFLILLLFQSIILIIIWHVRFGVVETFWTGDWTATFVCAGVWLFLIGLGDHLHEQSQSEKFCWAMYVYINLTGITTLFVAAFQREICREAEYFSIAAILHVVTCLSWVNCAATTDLQVAVLPTLHTVQSGAIALVWQNNFAGGQSDAIYTQLWLAAFIGTGIGTVGSGVHCLLQPDCYSSALCVHITLTAVTTIFAIFVAIRTQREADVKHQVEDCAIV